MYMKLFLYNLNANKTKRAVLIRILPRAARH